MTPETLNHCLNLLAGMPSSAPWTEATSAVYTLALKDWADDVAMGAVQWGALNLEWRPAPVKLREIAVRDFAAPPSPFALREQLRSMLLWHGGSQAACFADKIPLLAAVADNLGGWANLSRMTTDEIDSRFQVAYDAARGEWMQAVGETLLCLAPQERNRRLSLSEDDIRRMGRGQTIFLKPAPGDTSGDSHSRMEAAGRMVFRALPGLMNGEDDAA